jgi:hypothetical protein
LPELNPHTRWRLDFARQISERLRAFTGIRAMIVGGSVARGFADAYSDLELPIIWDQLPGDAVRLEIAAALEAEFLYPYNGPALEDNLLIQGFQVDLWHNSVANDEAAIRRVLQDYSTDPGDSNFMDTLRHCIPLMGEPLISQWKEMAAAYPPELAARSIEQAIQGFDLKQLDLGVRRDNPVLTIQTLSDIQSNLFKVWLALNKCYFPTLKWIFPTLESLQILPVDAAGRIRMMSAAPLEKGAVESRSLVLETLELVEKFYPGVEVASIRRKISARRGEMLQPVSLLKRAGEK